MSHPLERRLTQLRHRVERLLTALGVCAIVAGVLGGAIVFGGLDYLVRYQDRGLRIMASLAFAVAVGWTAYRCFILPRRKRLGDVDLAKKVERRFPELKDRLASAVDFLGQDENDPTAGSPALRRAVVAQTVAETESLDFTAAIDPRPATRAMFAAAGVCLLAGIFTLLDPGAAYTAAVRLLNPLGDAAWPRKNHLIVPEPVDRVARGGPFEVEIADADGNPLPSELHVFYRFTSPDGAATEENAVLRTSGKKAAVRRENVLRPFAYRVEGGDDRAMAWKNVDVVDPPAVESIAAKLIPPAYTGWPERKSDGNPRAIAGTRIEIRVKATKPLKSAKLALESGEEFPARLDEAGLRLTFDDPKFVAATSGGYRFELLDREGMKGGADDRYEIRVVPDAPPSVAVQRPSGNLYVTPVAAVPLLVSAKDDLAIREIILKYRIALSANGNAASTPGGETPANEQPAESSLTLYAGPEKPTPTPEGGADAPSGDRQTAEYRWELEPLQLAPGASVEFHAEASDYLPQTGRGEVRRLTVVTPRELLDRLAARQNLLAAELTRALTMQQAGREQTEGLRIRLQEMKRFEQPDLDRLRADELNQRQVNNLLTSAADGVPMHVLAILADLENNRLDTPELVDSLQRLLDELDRVGREHLPAIGRELTTAIKTAEISLNEPSTGIDLASAGQSLGSVASEQEQVVAALEKLLSQLRQAEGYQQFHRDLSLLLHDQEETSRRSGDVGKRTVTKSPSDLPPQDLADLRIVATRQLEHARTLDRILQAMWQAAEKLRREDPVAADTVGDALVEARQMAIESTMRSAGENLRQNQIGQAAAAQKEIVRQLQEVLDILANRRNQELDRLVKKLREASAEIDDLAKTQAELRQAMVKNSQNPQDANAKNEWRRLADQQARLQKETERLSRRLERLTADRAAESAKRAAGEMNAAVGSASGGNGAGACQGAGAAEKSLAETAKQLEEAKKQAELDLAMEQLSRMEDAVKQLHAGQRKAIEETDRLEMLRQTEGKLTRSRLSTLRDIAKMQRSLREDAAKLAEKLTAAGAFHLTLEGIAAEMGRAAELLDDRATGVETTAAQQNALRRLDLLLEALKPEPPPEKKDDGGGGGGGKKGNQPPGDGIKRLAELKLMKLLQREIQVRTVELRQAVGDAEPSDGQRREFARLAEEQGRLADLMLKMVQPAENAPEENPENAPEEKEEEK
jgi:hypothetical protein